MNKRKLTTILFAALASTMMAAQKQFTVIVTNPSSKAKEDAPVAVTIPHDGAWQSAIVTLNGKEIPSQLDDLDQDGWMDELAFTTNIAKKETQRFTVTLKDELPDKAYPARTFAEIVLRNPKVKEKNKHNYYLQELSLNKECYDPYHLPHHHGVAFENELIAMRIYFDERQTIDLYGKYHKGLELKETQFYTDKAQKAAGYGDDILWVGKTFGFGALRGWDGTNSLMITDVENRDQRIISQGPARTIVEVVDRGWKPQGIVPPRILRASFTIIRRTSGSCVIGTSITTRWISSMTQSTLTAHGPRKNMRLLPNFIRTFGWNMRTQKRLRLCRRRTRSSMPRSSIPGS